MNISYQNYSYDVDCPFLYLFHSPLSPFSPFSPFSPLSPFLSPFSPQALQLTGTKLFGIPIIVQLTMAEKNRLAAQAQNLMKKEGPKKLYIGSLHYNITEGIIKSIFEPFGHIEKLQIMRDEAGISKGFGFIEVSGIATCSHLQCTVYMLCMWSLGLLQFKCMYLY